MVIPLLPRVDLSGEEAVEVLVVGDVRQMLGKPKHPSQQNDPRILLDPEDTWLLDWKWTVMRGWRDTLYAYRDVRPNGARKIFLLHRVVADAPSDLEVDHINGNGLDNRRCNLRLANKSQNAANQRQKINNTSGFKGVSYDKSRRLWAAYTKDGKKHVYLGRFATPEAAARAYDKAVVDLFGEYALTNEMLGLYAQGGAQ